MGVRIAQREQGEPPAHVAKSLRAQLGGLFGLEIRWGRPRIVSGGPVVPEHAPLPRPSRAVSGIVFESSTRCIETPPDVANTLAKSAFRYIWRHLDTCQPDLGSGAARRGGSSPSSCTVVGAFSPAPLKCPPSGITKRVIQRGPTPDFWGPDPKRSFFALRRGGSSPSSCTTKAQGAFACTWSDLRSVRLCLRRRLRRLVWLFAFELDCQLEL